MGMSDTDNRNLTAALHYAKDYGWAVFPVQKESKRPLTPHGCKDAKKHAGAIKAWWKRHPDASIGIATGSISKLIVIDEDVDSVKGINGFESVMFWERDNEPLPETVQSITGRGGYHLFFRYDGSDIKNRAGLLEGVDVRGEGGYIIAPPSIHPNGTEYQWENAPEDVQIAELNDVVRRLLAESSPRNDGEKFQLPQKIESGGRNETLHRFACSLQAQGLSDDAIRAAVNAENAARCVPPLDDAEIDLLVGSALKYAKGELRIIHAGMPEKRAPQLDRVIDSNGELTEKIAQTVHNAEEAIMFDDELFGRVRFNEFSYNISVFGNVPWRNAHGWREWNNNDDSNLWAYIEHKYGIKDQRKIMSGINNVANRFVANPIKDFLTQALDAWDGNKHVENLLPRYTGTDKTEYNTAVLRLFMLGAVSRIFSPGCKFDYLPVLVGGQGTFKSSFLRFLAINDEWLHDNFNSLEGERAMEKLRGKWIIELAELQATKRAKDVESIKSFVTSRQDDYRPAYGRRTESHPRMCVFAGTSNTVDFLTDRSGNRRFLPVMCGLHTPENPWVDEVASKSEFMQAWGEIMDEYTRAGGKIRLILPPEIEVQAAQAQNEYLEDNPDIGIIQEWLDTCGEDRVCAVQVWREALGNEFGKPTRKEINEIHDIMRRDISGWMVVPGKVRCAKYGMQRCYDRDVTITSGFIKVSDNNPFD